MQTPVEMGRKFEELGAGSLLFTNIDTEGLMQGVNPIPTKELVESVSIPVIASGGVSSLQDLRILKETGAQELWSAAHFTQAGLPLRTLLSSSGE